MRLFLTGGTLRDHFMRRPLTKDFDFAVEAESFDAMKSFLEEQHSLTVWQERPEFVTLRGRATFNRKDFGGVLPRQLDDTHPTLDTDFTLCRAETMYSDRRHPDVVTPADIHTDLKRRDFTVNAIALAQDGTLIDPFDGINDAHMNRLRTVGSALDRFVEDPLRMFRAIRFVATHTLIMSDEISRAINFLAGTNVLDSLPVERVEQELTKAMRADWRMTMHLLNSTFPTLSDKLSDLYPSLSFKATLESK